MLQSRAVGGAPVSWPKDSQKYDLCINEEGLYELLFSSQQPLAKKVRKHCCNVMFPHIRQQLTDKMVEEHQRAVTVLKEDIQHKDEQIVIYENRIAHLRQRYVDHAKDPGLDNIVIIVRKHTTSEEDPNFHLPYYISRIQRRKQYVKLRWLERHFPDHEVIVEIDNPNSIHAFNRFEEEGHVERKFNHFRLIDLTRDNLFDMGISGGDYDED